jgi:FkbM family methyltransferase
MQLTHTLYKALLNLWGLNPLKKITATFLKISHFPLTKFKNDLWYEGVFSVHYFNTSFKLFANKNDKSTLSIFWDGIDHGWDAVSLQVWGKLAKKSSVIIDIGSNIGLYAIAAKKMNNSSKVFAFEPSNKMFNLLNKNITLNNLDIATYPVALSNFKGKIEFFDLDVPTAVASLKFNENLKNNENLITYNVDVNTIESFVQENNIHQIDLISIDVEMNEPEVLEGMGDLIKKFKPAFIIEILNDEVGKKVETFFMGLDYLFFEINEKDGLYRKNNLTREKEKKVDHSFNFLICTRQSAVELDLV